MNNLEPTQTRTEQVVIEWAPFKIRDGVTESQLLAASDLLQNEFVTRQNGFIRRELVKGENNQWVDIVYWASMADAKQAEQNAYNSPICLTYFGLMDNPEEEVTHLLHMRTYS
jgi:hypothetical protein